jgi:nitrate/nitrite transporter NarK
LGWTVIADTSPKELVGVNGGVFNLFGNLSTITTPTVIGFLVAKTGSFNDALVFVGATALVAIFSYVVIVGDIKRVELRTAA